MAIRELINHIRKETPVKISNYLDVTTITFLHAKTRDEALKILVDHLGKASKLKNKTNFFKAIIEREKIISTGIGMGVAIPHAKLKDFTQFFIAVGIQKDSGLEWNALDKAPVRLIFLIGGPDDRQTEYLQILSRLTFAIKDDELRKKLFKASNAQDVLKLLESY